MRVIKWNLSILMGLLMTTLMLPIDTAKRGHDHKEIRKHHRKLRQKSDITDSPTKKLEETRKKQSQNIDEHAPENHNYYVTAEMQYKATYRECPPFQTLKCRGSKCMYQSCDKQDKWQKDCSFTPIQECESKNWVCDCSNALGYYRLNSSSTECVHIDDIRCKNANVKCLEDEEKVCPSDDCVEKGFARTYGISEPKPICSSDKNCQKRIKCHCKRLLIRFNGKCRSLQTIPSDDESFRESSSVCPDNCEVKECINRKPNSKSLCPKKFTDEELYFCKKPLKFFCNPGTPLFLIANKSLICGGENTCEDNNIVDKGKYNVNWDYPYD